MEAKDQYRACVEGLRSFMADAGFSDAVVGLSGGMDSSVVAVMCVDALGADHVHGVLLPGPYSSAHSVEDAEALARNLRIDVSTVSIVEPYEAFARTLAFACGGALAGLAAENTQARCRMVCLMALSNAHGWMLVNTGNKSEAYTGYSTLYGDTAGAFAPIGGLYKTDVYAVARWRNGEEGMREYVSRRPSDADVPRGSERETRAAALEAASGGREGDALGEAGGVVSCALPSGSLNAVPPIPERVFAKPPSAELAPGQEDERSLGVDYATLDALLHAHVERGLGVEALVGEGFDEALVKRVLSRAAATAFKRALEPPAPDAKFYG
ncbi:NAD(+) synthase [Gordonibacter sp. An230]|uniref:NAD(+) synthase n=1 Tax=Gordonibacter sp. An230 TaxID=1965592 RepID=UPI000B3A68F1|nr:NAD(+) synthase [Gordonibacter sp. An230]